MSSTQKGPLGDFSCTGPTWRSQPETGSPPNEGSPGLLAAATPGAPGPTLPRLDRAAVLPHQPAQAEGCGAGERGADGQMAEGQRRGCGTR